MGRKVEDSDMSNEKIDKNINSNILELHKANDSVSLVSKIIKQKKELCNSYLKEIANISGMKRRQLESQGGKKKDNFIRNKKKKAEFFMLNEDSRNEISNRENKIENFISPSRNYSSVENSDKYFNDKLKLPLFPLAKKTPLSSLILKSKLNHNQNSFTKKDFDKKSFNSSKGNRDDIIKIKKTIRRNNSQDDMLSNMAQSKFDEFLNSISLKRSSIFNYSPSKKSVDNKIMVEKYENKKKFLVNFMNELKYNERYAQITGQLIEEQDPSIIKINKQILEEDDKLKIFQAEENIKPIKRDFKLFNNEIDKENIRFNNSIGKKKSIQSMSLEEKVMELDKSAKINPDIIYKYRKKLLLEHRIQLEGNDIIFSVPKVKDSNLLPPIQDNKYHQSISKIINNSKEFSEQILNKIKSESSKKERIQEMKNALSKTKGLKELDHIDKMRVKNLRKLNHQF